MKKMKHCECDNRIVFCEKLSFHEKSESQDFDGKNPKISSTERHRNTLKDKLYNSRKE
jgi:hypothetical protein